MRDNAAIHTTAVTRNYQSDESIHTITWPLCSPDLNLVDTLWSAMKTHIYKIYVDS